MTGNKDTILSIHSFFAVWSLLGSTFVMHSVMSVKKHTECALTRTRQNIIKTHIGPVGNRCVGESHYVGFDGNAWIGCIRDQNKQRNHI